jgi:CheY-like chemotaxis protein
VILVVDDDADVRETLCDVLADEGFPVAAARNGLEALTRLRDGDGICLILLDLMMPVMSGHEFLRERAADPRAAAVPVIVMSARWEGRHEVGAVEFLRKPPALTTVLEIAARHCGRTAGGDR